ncbi:glutamate--cysteine ligase [Vibrio sp.]|nr:glutamate--cysteine ligase [Vibrio sp.]
MTTFAARLEAVSKQTDVLNQLCRGVERETLRYQPGRYLSSTAHPKSLGSALTHDYITTDFSESQLEFITPVSQDIDTLLSQLKDIHYFTQSKLGDEQMWPLSMPCYVGDENNINLANYGSSNTAKMKTLYRKGLNLRYGSLMQIISGVHFNFSFPDSFWDALFGQQTIEERQVAKSDAYFGVIRNYYRFGWLIPYFFGASPALNSSFIQNRETNLPFEKVGHSLYLPESTSLRMSDLGYTNTEQSSLKIGFNSVEEYLEGLNKAIRTPSKKFAELALSEQGEQQQLNTNVLQIENELYAPIRPKRVAKSGEKPSEALERGGVEYIEVRAMDVNPFSPIGIDEDQIRFLDLFLTWCALTDSAPMSYEEQSCWSKNWEKVIIEGRKPGLELQIGCNGHKLTLQEWAKEVFSDLGVIAKAMDGDTKDAKYQSTYHKLTQWIDNPDMTFSARLLDITKKHGGICGLGNALIEQHQAELKQHQYQAYTQSELEAEVKRSLEAQSQAERTDEVPFNVFLSEYFSYLK